jgi:hypothetical protein
MDEQKNGAHVADHMMDEEELPSLPPGPEQPPQATPQQAMTQLQQIEQQVSIVVSVNVRGILVSAPGVPSGIVMQQIAFATGKILAMLLAGNPLEMTVKARADFRKGFENGMAKVPVLQMGAAQMPQAGPDLRR